MKLTKTQRRLLTRLAKKPMPAEYMTFGNLVDVEHPDVGLIAKGLARQIRRRMSPSFLTWLISYKGFGWQYVFAITAAGRRALQSKGDANG